MTLSYETAKKLKEAGFPQTGEGLHRVILGEDNIHAKEDSVYIPTLSELIEACELKTFRLESWKDGWKAGDYKRISMKRYALGSTPSEAVAALWFSLQALNKQ